MSSLPPAKSEISEKPSKNSVTRAVDPRAKEADTERASRLFGVVQAFREGRYPDNKQIDDTLKYTLAHSPIDETKLSSDGRTLVKDVRELIESARQMVMEKNSNEEFQNFLYATRKADVARNVNVASPLSKDEAQKHGESAGEAFRTLVTLFLRNGELRKIFQDLGYVGRDMFADGAAKAAEVSRPHEEKLAQVDQPAPDNEFHDEIPGALQKRKAEEKAERAREAARTEGADHAQDVADTLDPNASREQNQARLADKANEKANILSSKIPQKHKDNLREQADKTQDYLKEKFPKERRDQFIYRLKKVVIECQRHPDYEDAIDYFMTLFEQYKGHASSVQNQATQSASQVRGEGNVATAENAFRTLIERFANGRPTQPILDAIDQLYTDARNDGELRDWFQRLDTYVRRALQEPGFIMKDEADTQARQLRDSGKKFFVSPDASSNQQGGKYQPHFKNLANQIEFFFKGMGDDPLNQKFGEDIKRLTKDLFLNADGKPSFKPHLWADVSKTIGPALLSHIGPALLDPDAWYQDITLTISFLMPSVFYPTSSTPGSIPLPRMEYADKQNELLIEDLNIDPLNVLPSVYEIENRNHMKFSAFKEIPNQAQHSLKLTIYQIQLDIRDVNFHYRRMSGFKIQESGRADILLGGKGLTLQLALDSESRKNHIFTVKSVKASIDKMSFAIKGTKHDLLAKLVRPLAIGLIKKSICKAAEQGIRNALEDLDRNLVELRDRAERNKDVEGKGFGDAFKETFQKDKSSASDKESKGTFKFVTSKRQSMMPDVGHPDGLVQRLDERSELAKSTGNSHKEWYSPAFNLVAEGQPNPKNTESAKTAGLGSKQTAATAAGAAGVGAGAAGIAAATASRGHGAGQPGQTSTAYTNPSATNAGPSSATAPTGSAFNGNSIYYQDDVPQTTKAAPPITNALPTTTTGAAPNTTSTL
ncbi:uncharacterized protein PFL1_05365 [Pseudozyma flocculosa PF-1]|uniref:Uncharacterized protein n=1 Tax=Pseudozyma flocculosa PF-1 TaxID=1277687 RepID=A0A061H921_9BASI|nr:uncharacterized protein PFL1_05365 [Pseudozyma flocculosa PF-1]EPQ27081.1 hypothetical protein PFL1_05365 [Pseudozyma flocculosa PF-1]